jgi:hypothetical protein
MANVINHYICVWWPCLVGPTTSSAEMHSQVSRSSHNNCLYHTHTCATLIPSACVCVNGCLQPRWWLFCHPAAGIVDGCWQPFGRQSWVLKYLANFAVLLTPSVNRYNLFSKELHLFPKFLFNTWSKMDIQKKSMRHEDGKAIIVALVRYGSYLLNSITTN